MATLTAVGMLGIPAVALPASATERPANLLTAGGRPAAAGHVPAAAHPAKARAGRALAAAPVGKLAPSGCTEGSGAASCDLYAMTGTTTVLGTSIPIWGFSSTGADGTATAPGPVLAVHQGDQVTITLHNQVPGEQVSLALPGQVAAASNGKVGDDVTGVAAGATQTYTFTAGRAGTFLYEAGHTADGARQVAMGLAGALVVLPSDGSAYGSDAAYPTTYDDDAVMVLSEIDPALNADPAKFDMRSFAPRYRLINGKPFPAADPVSTDQGHTVLLRYVNAGAQTHAMRVLGGDQVEIAEDGHARAFTTTVSTESIEPGQTLDTTVTMPTGPESKLAVYEAAQHLDNDGQHTADPLQTAFGGMLTFLDTNAPAPSSDSVGPVSSHVKVSPNPSDGLHDVTVTADVSDATTGGARVTQAEFVIDDAETTGAGFGVPMTGSFGTTDVAGVQGTIPASVPDCAVTPVALSCLDAGKHTVFVRALDSNGNWGVVGSVILNLPKTGPRTTNGSVDPGPANGDSDVAVSATGDDSGAGGTITDAEYFIDTVGADGTGTPMSRNRTAAVVSEDATIAAADVKALGEGVHHVFVHSKDSLGLWGPTLDIPLTVDTTGPTVDAASVGPNPTNGLIGDKANPGYLVVSAQVTDRDAGGALQGRLQDAEGFLDPKAGTTPPGGTGFQLIAVDGKMDSTTEAVYGLIPLSQVKSLANGEHHVFVRGQDDAGNWGALFVTNLVVDRKAPVLGTLKATPNPTGTATSLTLSAPVDETRFTTAEFWTGTRDPGVGRATRVPVSLVGANAEATVSLKGLRRGSQQLFHLRVQDLAGNWSNAVSVTVRVG